MVMVAWGRFSRVRDVVAKEPDQLHMGAVGGVSLRRAGLRGDKGKIAAAAGVVAAAAALQQVAVLAVLVAGVA